MLTELTGALFTSCVFLLVGFLVIPKEDIEKKNGANKSSVLLKGVILTFCSSYLVLYFMMGTSKAEAMKHVIVSEPDF